MYGKRRQAESRALSSAYTAWSMTIVGIGAALSVISVGEIIACGIAALTVAEAVIAWPTITPTTNMPADTAIANLFI